MAFYSSAITFPEQCWKRFACWVAPCTVQVAHGVWKHKDAGVLPALLGSSRTGARSAARICRETCDQNDQTCLLRFLSGRGKVTWPPGRVGSRATRAAGRSDRLKPRRAMAIAAP